jgi:hypothetical protein
MNGKESKGMNQILHATGGEEHIVAFFKRNDQCLDGARDMEPVGYVLASEWERNRMAYPKDMSDLMCEAFVCCYLKMDQLPFLRDAITKNCDWKAQNNTVDRVLLESSLLVGKTGGVDAKSAGLIAPVSLVSASGALLKQVKVSGALADLKGDLKAITTGAYTYGAGGGYSYLLQSTAYADLGNLTGALSLTQKTALTETAGSVISIQLDGNTFTDDGGNFADIISGNITSVTLNGTAGAAGVINYINDNSVRDATVLSAIRYFLNITATVAHTININNVRYDGAGKNFASGIAFTSGQPLINLRNFIVKNCSGTGTGVSALRFIAALNANTKIENGVFDTCALGVYNANNRTNSIKNVFFTNNTGNYSTPTGSTSVNCAAGAAAVGAATDTNPQVNAVVANELINTTITDLVDGYRLKSATSTKLKSNGAAPGIAGNTTDIFGRARPDGAAGYSIGVAERAIPTITSVAPSSGVTAGGTAISIAGINHFPNLATHAVVTVGGGAATGEASSATKTDCATPSGTAGAQNVVLTNSDGEAVTSAGGYTYADAATGQSGPVAQNSWSNRLDSPFKRSSKHKTFQ